MGKMSKNIFIFFTIGFFFKKRAYSSKKKTLFFKKIKLYKINK